MKLRSSKIYGLDLEVMSRSFAHDVIPLKDSHDVELTNHNKSITDGNERCEAIKLMAAQQRFQPLAKFSPDSKLK
jgi:hypothetical protein